MNDNKTDDGVEHSLVSVSQFKCKQCGNEIVARVPSLRVFNFPECSGVVMAHQAAAKCHSCETLYIPLIGEISERMELKFIWKPVNRKHINPAPVGEALKM